MSLITKQTWDGVTAPATPSDWFVNSGLVSTTGPSGSDTIAPYSSANMLVANAGGGQTTATWTTQEDGNSGNIQISALCACGSNFGTYSVLLRGNSSALSYATSTMYEIYFTFSGTVGVNKIVSGTSSSLQSVAVGSSIYTNTWWDILGYAFTSNGNVTISAYFQVPSTGYYLQSGGGTTLTPTLLLNVTDSSSPIIGQGYCGLATTTSTRFIHVYADDYTLSTYGDTPNGRPPVARVADELEFYPGKVTALASRNISPAPQQGRARNAIVQGWDLPTDPGSVIVRGQRTLVITRFIQPCAPLTVTPRELPPSDGSAYAQHAKDYPRPQNRPGSPFTTAQEQPPEAGRVITDVGATGFPRTDQPRAQRIASVEAPPLEPGGWVKSSVQPHVNLRPSPGVIASCEALAPYAGNVFYDAASPPAIARTSTARAGFIATSEPLAPHQGQVTAARGTSASFPAGLPPHATIVRPTENEPDAGVSVNRHGPRAYDWLTTRSVIAQQEQPVEPGQTISRSIPVPYQVLTTRSVIIQQEQPTESGHVFTDVNPVATMHAQPRAVIATATELAPDVGRVIVDSVPLVSIPRFSRPARTWIAVVEQPTLEAGMVHSSLASQPAELEYVSNVDPDLATLIIVQDTSISEVDPDLASLVI